MATTLESIVNAVNGLDMNTISKFTGTDINTVDDFMNKTRIKGEPNYSRGFTSGLIAGVVAAGIKMLVDETVAPDQEQIEDKAMNRIVDSAEELFGRELTIQQQAAAATVLEVGLAGLVGGVYGLVVESMPEMQDKNQGENLEMARKVAIPLMGLAPASVKDTAVASVKEFAGHATFGATLEILRRTLRYAMEKEII